MERVEDGSSMNVMPSMFHAGISNKFTKRHLSNFCDTTLAAASAAKQRAELKLERQANAIEKQQQKIDNEMKKIAEITQNLHRQQLREAKRLRNRLNYAASKIQSAYRRHLAYVNQLKREAAVVIQTLSHGFLARRLCWRLRLERKENKKHCSSVIISTCLRKFAARNIRAREIEVRDWAACSIQRLVRMAAARSSVRELRRQRQEVELQHRAAILIQCNARSFMTRLIYLDVLYLICRIQAAMRGCLVRRQLRWIRASDVDAIAKFQARIRGFLLRRRIEYEQDSVVHDRICSSVSSSRSSQGSLQKEDEDYIQAGIRIGGGFRTARASCFASDELTGRTGITSLLRSSTGLATVEPAIKRSYWLPAGASFDKRLPVLPVPKRMMALERGSGDPFGDDLRLRNQSWTPKKRPHQKPCPVRLSPVVIPSVRREARGLSLSEADVEETTNLFEKEERLLRQEDLRQKLQLRRIQVKRQQEYELKLQREAETEANEKKLMEREERAVRLQLKILRRRSKEGKTRQVTADQRREERERLAMAREERHGRLHAKFCARQHIKKRQQLATASATSESESQSSSTSSNWHKALTRRVSSRFTSKKDDDVSSDDGGMSFPDINFTVPRSMKPRKQLGNKTGRSQTRKPRMSSTQVSTMNKKSVGGKSKRISTTNRSIRREMVTLPVETTAEEYDFCEYGDEFDDVVDEAALGHLICSEQSRQ